MLATIPSAILVGVRGLPVSVEAHIGQGLPATTLVGLPDTACREGVHRLRAAFVTSGVAWPSKRLTISLSPPGIRKLGSGLDLPIALAILVAAGSVSPAAVAGIGCVGELGLDGTIRPVAGLVPLVASLTQPRVLVPAAAVDEARVVVAGERLLPVGSLNEVLDALTGARPWPDLPPPRPPAPPPPGPDLADVRGQAVGRQALEVAAAGGHHLLLVGPPGAGKTMLAQRLPGILPPLAGDEALEATCIRSAAGEPLPPGGLVTVPPLRAPHHSASAVSVIGGGTAHLRPGEISLAAHGVLFLDELGEFPPTVLDSLRTPLEEGVVRISRARRSVQLPARVLLVAATNPCPCGGGVGPAACRCGSAARARYLRRLSGPLLDRFDLRVELVPPEPALLLDASPGEPSSAVAARVLAARALAAERGVPVNAALRAGQLDEWARPDPAATRLLDGALRTGRLSARGLARVRAVARTLADLAGDASPVLSAESVALALAFRPPVAVAARLAG